MRTRSVMAAVAALVAAAALAGCANVDSTQLRTGGMRADIGLIVSRDHTVVQVHLSAGGLTDVLLAPGESLRATAGSRSVELHHVDALGNDFYSGNLAVGAPGTVVTVALRRTPADVDAPSSTVTLPPALVVRSPRPDQQVRRSRDLEVRTSPGDGVLAATWVGGCLVDADYEAGDGDTAVVVPAGMRRRAGRRADCLATLGVSRTLTGTLDPAYGSGTIQAVRRIRVVVRTVP